MLNFNIISLLLLCFLSIIYSEVNSDNSNDEFQSRNIIEPFFPLKPKYRLGLLVFDDFVMLDLVGPAEILGDQADLFETISISTNDNKSAKPIFGALDFKTKINLNQAKNQKFDILLIPGGSKGTDRLIGDPEFIKQYSELCNNSQVVFTVCTGSFVLAKTGLIDNIKATSNKLEYSEKTPLFPKVQWIPSARWVHHKKYITSSGVTAGMDAALYILSLAKSKDAAKKFAYVLEYVPHLSPDDDPFAVNVTKV